MINQPEGAEYWRGGLVVTIEMHLSLTSITSADKINIKYFDEQFPNKYFSDKENER